MIPDVERGPDDTPRLSVDWTSFVPGIMNPPFPASIADELTSKYRLERTQHDDEYVAQKIVEDARSAWYESRRLITPAQQRLEQLAQQRREQEEKQVENGEVWKILRDEVAQASKP